MTGQSVATGGDASATATARNWRAVKVDGYGIQSTSTIDLEGQAFSYTTVAGEYCNSVQLRNCTASASATGSYTYPARLRWCSTAAYAVDTTANAGTFCQASNIDDTPTNIANGVTPYIYARMPAQSKATITVGAATTVTNITVNGAKIISSGATGATSTDLATDIAAKINACTYAISGTCGIVGFRAVSMLNVVTVTAPMATTATPVVTAGVAMTASAFSSGNVPGASLFTVIQPRRTASIIVDVAGTATGITVGGSQILSAGATGGNAADLATDIAAKINACAIAVTGSCTVAGYSAVSQGNAVTVTAPGSAAAGSPVVTGVAATSSAFSGGVFPYPGSAVKNSNRSDCAGTTCTYEEEMTNYANWYAYYRTRMQMMKTSASIAFSTVDENYRVGYFSINNGAGSQYLNLSAFDGTQKNLWYSKFFNAVPYGSTPLRTGLANSGRLYAGMLGSLNGVTVVDPVQYSCQQNFTILSTDGYWNDSSSPKQINGSDEIGQQDGNLNRPYYDGSTYTKTVSQTLQSFQQKMMNTFFVESRTSQLQTSTSRLSQEITTTTTQPWKLENSQLQTRVKPLEQSVYALESRTYPLLATTKVLHENTFNPQSTTRPLEKSTFMLTETSTPLKKTVTRIVSSTYPLQVGTEQTIATTTPLQRGTQATYATTTPLQRGTQATYATTTPLQRGTQATLATTTPLQRGTEATQAATTPLQRGTQATYATTTPLQRGTQATYATTTPLQRGVQAIYATVSPLQSTTYKLQSLNFKLQKRSQVYNGVTEHWDDGAWADVTSGTCAVVAAQFNAEGTQIAGAVECQYVVVGTTNGLSSCTDVPKSTSSPYSVRNANICSYETTPTVAAVATCNVASRSGGSPYQAEVACGYGASGVAAPAATCTPNNQTGASSMSGDKVVCSVDATVVWSNSATCSPANPNYPAGTPQVSCKYDTTNTSSPVAGTCTANDQTSSLSTLGASISGDKVACSVASTVTWANSATCSPANPNYPAGTPQVSCRYDTNQTTASTPGATCVANDQSALMSTIGASISGNQVLCSLAGVNWVDATGTPPTCTPAPQNYATGTPRISCRYRPTEDVSKRLTDQLTCAAYSQPTNAPMSGNQVTCAYQATPYSVTVETNCQWTTSATAATAQVTCAYDTGANTQSGPVGSCSRVDQSTGSSEGTMWSGPAKSCAYRVPTVATNQPNCTHYGSQSSGPNYSYYETCAYGTASVTSASSCNESLPESGPDFIRGATVSCSYPATPTSVSGSVSSCNWVAPSPTWATPVKTCTYDAATTGAVSSCTDITEGSGGTGTYYGPATVCAYSTTPSATNLNASSCSAQRQTASPYTQATAVDCSFKATPTVSTVTSCTKRDEIGPAYTGAKTLCAYNASFGAWSDVTSGSCVAADQSGATGPSYAVWRECRYDPRSDTYAGTCNGVTASSSPNYTVRNPVTCVPGSYVVSSVTPPATTVDTCNAGTVTTGNVNGTPPSTQVDVITACTYAASPTVVDASSCTEHLREGSPPYTTEVTCPYTTGSWVKAATTAACVPVGTQPPPASMVPADFVGGKNVECRITEPAIPGTGTAASPLPDPSCTPGPVYIDGSNVQTNCVYSINTTPTPVDPTTCTPTVGLPSGPSYIKQTCATSTPSTTVMGCTPLGPTSPLWQTVTCVDNGDGPKNTLADVAAYYYGTDLRTDALNNCTGATVPPATAGSVLCTSTDPMNNVRVSANDPNAFQHMVTYTLGLGASGYMKYSDTYSVDTTGDFPTVKGNSPYAPSDGITANPGAGVCSWQTTDLCNWPVPKPNEQTTIDDLWHAAVNGHGAYYSAGDPESLSAGISAALTGVAGAAGTISAPSFSTSNLNRSDNYLFSSSYVTSDWVGDVVRYRVNPYSGRLLPVVDWSAQSKLDAKATRTIYTFDASVATTKLKAFTSANYATNNYFNKPHISTSPTGLTQFLCASSEICLSATDQDTSHAAGANLVEYLRGARTNEGTEIDNTKYYRLRQHLLGDMVNAPTVYVGKPYREYLDPGYATFKANSASRKAVVYAGANDGMLHAFAAKGNSTTEAAIDAYSLAYEAYAGDTDNAAYLTAVNTAAATASAALSSDTSIGQELWAYIPSMALPNLYKLADKKYKDKHRYFLDGPAVTADICVSDCNSASSVWKTILVGGLARGGRGYFALDVTDPDNPKALWEFTDTHLGYSYGNPQVTKLSDGTWVVIVASGYNNIPNDDGSGGDGVGRLYVLNAATGVQVSGLSPISTGYGSTTSPGGLSNINAMVVDPSTDNTVLAVYGGDLGGNLWRFDVNGSVGPSGYEAQLLAVLKDGSGNRQPVTTKPTVSLVKGQKVIFVGTVRFLDTSDVTDTSQQSMYAIKDPWTTGGAASTAIFDNPGDDRVASASNSKGFVKQSLSWHDCPTGTSSSICNSPARVMKVTRNSVNFATDNGWFIDFINDSERLNTNPALGLGMLTMVTNAPSLLACDVGGKSYIYFLDYETGGYIVSATNPGGVGGYQLANSFASAPTIVVRSSPDGGIAAPVVMTVIQDTSKYVGPGSAGNSPSGGSGSGSSGNPCVGPACTTDPPTVTNISPLQRSSWRELIWE